MRQQLEPPSRFPLTAASTLTRRRKKATVTPVDSRVSADFISQCHLECLREREGGREIESKKRRGLRSASVDDCGCQLSGEEPPSMPSLFSAKREKEDVSCLEESFAEAIRKFVCLCRGSVSFLVPSADVAAPASLRPGFSASVRRGRATAGATGLM